MSEIDALSDQIAALEEQMRGARSVTGAFEGELARMREGMVFTDREVTRLTTSFGGGLRRAFDGLVFDGLRLSDALRQVAKSMVGQVYATAMRPVQNAVGGALASGINAAVSGALPFADGGAFTQGRVMPFAKGGIVSGPVMFPMRGGRGLMGEAGPEAIMPLTRGADGKLGVQAQGGGRPVNVVMNIQTPDVQGFHRSQSQIAAQMTRALGRGQRNR
ncbi:phage tail tape measure protein [Halodurantibacterium flavum]|uniref:Phage tail tape measure protein n=1 Tax=Halodurantibacterium flavum TaxID=1382802 RepID=A0ABW4S579_9RHOB